MIITAQHKRQKQKVLTPAINQAGTRWLDLAERVPEAAALGLYAGYCCFGIWRASGELDC